MTKVINGTRVNALTKQTLDFSFRSMFSPDDYSRVNEVISLNPCRRNIVGMNGRKEKLKFQGKLYGFSDQGMRYQKQK